MTFQKKTLFALALAAATSVSALTGASAQTAPTPQQAAVELDVIQSFSDTIYARRLDYFKTVKASIDFKTENFSDALKAEYSETFRDFTENEPRRTNWMFPTDTGWVSAGGADLYDLHLSLMATARQTKDGKVLYGPVMVTEAMKVDLKDHTKRFEARFGNKILAFRSAENRDAYKKLVEEGRILELQDMQCAMAPVHPTRPHLAAATRMIVVAEELTGKDGKPVYVRTYNSAHVYASYDLNKCAPISNAAFKKFSDEGRSAAGASVLVKRKELDDMRVPAYTPINPIQNVQCKPVS
jgi:hypothetical protein